MNAVSYKIVCFHKDSELNDTVIHYKLWELMDEGLFEYICTINIGSRTLRFAIPKYQKQEYSSLRL